jgi:putative RNA 2'-phosphotransferase
VWSASEVADHVEEGAVTVRNSQSSRISRRLAYVLRHRPDSIGVALDSGGWVEVSDLLAALAAHGLRLTSAELERIVRTSPKQRFGFDSTGTRIRAAQGHSVPVDLGLPAVLPPPVLYHGTTARFLPAITRDGLHPQGRHHVHLSPDWTTARQVGARRGKPVVLRIDAAGMAEVGTPFYRSANGVWLVDAVPSRFLHRTTG